MGIRVVCPNGHKLNVKSFLAGKRGVCPHCQAKFDIPATPGKAEESDEKIQNVGQVSATVGGGVATAPSTSSAELRASHLAKGANPARRSSQVPLAPVAPVAPSVPAAQSQPLVAQVSVAPARVQPAVSAVPVTTAPAAAVAPIVPASPLIPSVAAARPGAVDPLSEAPEACWYVRPPSGGQYGPAKSNIMRQWLSEGRVTGDSLVWREGWADWKLASATFSTLGAPATAPSPVGEPAFPVPAAPESAAEPFPGIGIKTAPSKSASSRRGGGHGNGRLLAVAVLCVALVVLSALLVYVLKLQ